MSLFQRQPAVLLVEDDSALCDQLQGYLSSKFTVHTAGSAREALDSVAARPPDLVVADIRLPDEDGLHVLQSILTRRPNMPVVVMTAYGNVELAVKAMKGGAVDFINKPFGAVELEEIIGRHVRPAALERRRGEERKHALGESPQMQAVREELELFAHTDVTILLQGETGVGKELLAQSIHRLSKYAKGPFAPLDCACLPEELVESEIFGYERGAFTGASSSKRGRLEMADGGTLFLDEIGNLSLLVQAKLLRVLQERQVQRLGCKTREPIDLDFRVIAAANVDLAAAAKQGAFRSDLLYRVNPVTIYVPPLREREGDVALLAGVFVERNAQRFGRPVTGVTHRALQYLEEYEWPGNVRELKNVMKKAVLTARRTVDVDDLPITVLENKRDDPDGSVRVEISLDPRKFEKLDLKAFGEEARAQAEEQVLRRVVGTRSMNRLQLADFLQVDTKTLRSKLDRYGLG